MPSAFLVGIYAPRCRGHRPRRSYHLCAKKDDNGEDDSCNGQADQCTRRRFLVIGAAVVAGMSSPVLLAQEPNKASAITVAPVPINAYGKRKRKLAYKKYLQDVEARTVQPALGRPSQALPKLPGETEEDRLPFQVAGVAAMVASALSTALAHPIDTVKTRIQAGQVPLVLADSFLGLPSLYRGLASNVLKEAPNAGVYLGIYELVKSAILLHLPFLRGFPLLVFMTAGAIGDAVGSTIRVPAEIVNKRMQLGLCSDWLDAIRTAFCTRTGLQSSLKVWVAILLRDVPYGALQIGIYEQTKLMIQQSVSTPSLGLGESIDMIVVDVIVGAVAGLVAAFLTTPSDVLVTRLSSQNPQSYLETRRYMGIRSTLRRILDEEGFGGLWKGSLQRGLYYMPLIGVFFALYELTKHFVIHPDQIIAMVEMLDVQL